ncbi:MAG: DUF3368 domain-containing protein [Bacteroidetes bacterium]|nr:DUF3368 domain-containing protein [Crocinitomicaceae bacterium]MCB0838585.1 DUF3368 domain-containing protein [Bacteroidota bacterium]MCB0844300.1 DUF3368 domain-containing protein [Bacteroidota bacterium]MCB0855515.1 DUF3368 domain-containing protein [Bacteroidota bacterium]
MIVVSDTSAISSLLVINRLDLLEKVYGHVIIPRVVLEEILALENFGYDISAIHEASWLEITEPSNRELEAELHKFLDAGESAAIALAKELNPDYLIIDEKKGREAAKILGVAIIGLVGILIEAKEQKIITQVKPILDELMEKAGFRISSTFYSYILNQIDESPI